MRSRRIGKKGQINELMIHLPIIMYVFYVVIITIVMLNFFVIKKVDIEEAELRVIDNRMIIAASQYDLDTSRVNSGIIDNKNLAEIDKNIDFKNEKRAGAKITIGQETAYYNKKWYDFLRPRVGYDVKIAKQDAYIIKDGKEQKIHVEAVT